ncbi:MAG: ComF family protein [Alistipes sp.]|nr:ComF family protein [Alistipes sp.]
MSMLRRLSAAIGSLLFPRRCVACGEYLTKDMHGICVRCRYEIPLTHYWKMEDNPVKERFAGIVPIAEGSALFFYAGHSLWRTLVHKFKYGGHWHIARTMGRWYGSELRSSGRYDDVDIVVPIPLHPVKMLRRGYNQSAYVAEGIAEAMGLSVVRGVVYRRRNNPSQARRHTAERWQNIEGLFGVRHPERLRAKHILLVDDVLTTGATMTEAIRSILEAVPECRISVATLAVTRHITPIR